VEAALLAYSRGDQATPQILFFLSIPKPFLSFDETSFKNIQGLLMCGLTREELLQYETEQICQEHEPALYAI